MKESTCRREGNHEKVVESLHCVPEEGWVILVGEP